jgi:predicted outer membrane protein
MHAEVRREALILLALAVLFSAGCGGGPMSKKDLQKQTEAVQSFAAEGSLLADQAARGRSTEPFVRVHTEYLDKALKKVETELKRPVADAQLKETQAASLMLAGQLSDELGQLHRAPGDRNVAARVKSDLADVADSAEKLAK